MTRSLTSLLIAATLLTSLTGCDPVSTGSASAPQPAPTHKPSPLTGVVVPAAVADRPVVSVIIENHPAARPQSGLAEAGVVYEALAEGGITRFQAFYLETLPASIGPVRSLRPYFIDWGLEYGAPITHAGGSPDALRAVGPLGAKSLDGLAIGPPAFHRTSDRAAPHNLYTSADQLNALLAQRGYNQPTSFTPPPRQNDAPTNPAKHPSISISYSTRNFEVAYQYDAATNSYVRSLAGRPHLDLTTGQPIKVKNIVVEYMPTTTLRDGHLQMQTLGRGTGLLFRDGDAIAVTWVKDDRPSRTKLLTTTGTEVPLNPGNTWYSIVPTGRTVRY